MKAAVQVKNMSSKNSSDCWTFVRTECSGSESSDAAWAVEKILEFVLKQKQDVYSHLSPIARSVLAHVVNYLSNLQPG